jgi:hypothetical protein
MPEATVSGATFVLEGVFFTECPETGFALVFTAGFLTVRAFFKGGLGLTDGFLTVFEAAPADLELVFLSTLLFFTVFPLIKYTIAHYK